MTKLVEIAVDQVIAEDRYRKEFGDISELAADISKHGLIQPISITEEGKLIAGGRRLAAAIEAGLEAIPAIVREGDSELDLLELELIENLYRKDMEWWEESALSAEIYRRHAEVTGEKSQRKSAKICGKSLADFARDIKLATAVKAMPELKQCKNKSQALSTVDKLLYSHDVKENVAGAREALGDGGQGGETPEGVDQGEPGAGGDAPRDRAAELARLFKRAESNFRVGDALEGMEALAEQQTTFGFIEVDPPYGIDLDKQKAGASEHSMKEYNEIERSEYPEFLRRTADAVYQAAAPNAFVVFWFGWSWFEEVKTALRGAGFDVDDIPGIWVKAAEDGVATGQTQQPATHLARSHEPFFIARKGKPRLRKEGRSNVFSFKPVPGSQKYHPTQRPIALMEELVNTFCYPGMQVLVPFLGSGVTLLAVYSTGFSGMGWDLSQENKTGFLNHLLELFGEE